jgi:rhamnogalacturonan endolyase
MRSFLSLIRTTAALVAPVAALLNATESTTQLALQNERLRVTVDKKSGQMSKVILDGQDLTGSGKGPYLDCHCTPDGFWAPGAGNTRLVQGIDSEGKAYGGIIVSDTYSKTNQSLEQYWFLREGEA